MNHSPSEKEAGLQPAHQQEMSISRFRGLELLMPYRIREMMLVSNLYDSFILEEDGHISELLLQEYRQLNLWYAPRIRRAPSAGEALSLLKSDRRFDLVVPTMRLGDMEPPEFAQQVREITGSPKMVLLGYESPALQSLIEQRRSEGDQHPIDRLFLWTGDARVLLAIVNLIEDERNAEHDTKTVGVDVIIFVEDSIRFASAYLPMLYTQLMRQSQSLISEGINLTHKVMRMRARPKILWCETYEEACATYEKYKKNVLGVISDVRFSIDGRPDSEAGFKLVEQLRSDRPDLPMLLQSTDMTNIEQAIELKTSFVHKHSPWLAQDVRRFMLENFGFGPFVFRLPDGTETARAHNQREMLDVLRTAPAESLLYHAERNHFSTWLKARTHFRLAAMLRPIDVGEFPTIEAMRQTLITGLADERRDAVRGAIADFKLDTFDSHCGFARIGGGSIGGKARGLAFLRKLLRYLDDAGEVSSGVNVFVPPTIVIGTDLYDQFLEQNQLTELMQSGMPDPQMIETILQANLPEELLVELAQVLEIFTGPLAVRSSSILEDSLEQPFAGIYDTYMLPNQSSVQDRLRELCLAVKRVYASSFLSAARTYMKAMPHQPETDRMAVIIQQLVGRKHGTRFYPDFAGVARSYNYYPFGNMKPEDGVAYIGLGFGQTVVDGYQSLRFCPRYPKSLPQFSTIKDILNNSQKNFFALDLDQKETDWLNRTHLDGLAGYPIQKADEDGTLAPMASVYDHQNEIITEGVSRPGARIATFSFILKHNTFPLAPLLTRLLNLGRDGMSSPVEIEFAANLGSRSAGEPAEFACLQMRPLAMMGEAVDLDAYKDQRDYLLCESPKSLGHGRIENLCDMVCVLPDEYDWSESVQTAAAVGEMNAFLKREERPYILMGPGRWGSSDPSLGIPVQWGQISGARVVVEAGLPDRPVTPSEGSHFFQNLTAFHVGYLMVNRELGEGHVDWNWIAQQPAVRKGINGLRWIRLKEPILTLVDGRSNRGIIIKPGHENHDD